MRRYGPPFRLPRRLQWLTWPVLALSGGGTAVALWLEEDSIALAECAPLAALPALAALLYGFNLLVFKATRPRRKDLETSDRRETTTGGR